MTPKAGDFLMPTIEVSEEVGRKSGFCAGGLGKMGGWLGILAVRRKRLQSDVVTWRHSDEGGITTTKASRQPLVIRS